jgi:CHAT domain-containing protein/Tfp pilus assembly protein PilF
MSIILGNGAINAARMFIGYMFLFVILSSLVFGQKQKLDVRSLSVGENIKRQFKSHEIHIYEVEIKQGQVLQIDLQEKDRGVRIALMSETDKKIVAEADLGVGNERETLTFIAEQSGLYGIAVIPSSTASGGGYEIKADIRGIAGPADKERIKAEKLLAEGMSSAIKQTESGYQEAISKLEEALPVWQALKDDYWTRLTTRRIREFNFLLNPIDVRPLSVGQTTERRIWGGDAHLYSVTLEQGQVLRVDVREIGFDLIMGVLKVGDDEVSDHANFGFGDDRETLTFIAGKTDKYMVMITAPKSHLTGSYQMKAEIKETATAQDRERIKAERLVAKAFKEWKKDSAQGTRGVITILEESLPVWKSLGDKYWEAHTLTFIGRRYDEFDEKAQALECFKAALPLWKAIDEKEGEAATLNNIGLVYSELGEKERAIDYYEQAINLYRVGGSRRREALILGNIGNVYSQMGESKRALDYLNQAASLSKSLGDEDRLANTLNNIGGVYGDLGDRQKALDYYNQALPLWIDEFGRVKTLNNIGTAYSNLGEKQKALGYYGQALQLSQTIGSKSDEAIALLNIGSVHSHFGKEQEALGYYSQALPLWKAIGDKKGEATTLNNLGAAYRDIGDRQKALEYMYQALALERITDDKREESITSSNAMLVWESLKNPRMAVLFGKRSVNLLQELRGAARGLENESQKSFRRRVGRTYQYLTELLIETGQVDQAIQVLSLYQDEQFFDFTHGTNSPVKTIPLSQREQEITTRYENSLVKVGQIGLQVEELKRQSSLSQLTGQGLVKLKKLEAELRTANDAFLAILRDAEQVFARPLDEKDKVSVVKDVEDMKSTLRELSISTRQQTAALYTLIGGNKLYIILLTPSGEVKPFASEIKSEVLIRKIVELHAILQSPAHDPRPLGEDLYKIIFKPVEATLKKSGVQTLMWQLDGNLRYVPVAALFDGERYLVEQYQNVVFTRTDRGQMRQTVKLNWTGTGFGSSQEQTVDLIGDGNKIPFPALPGVRQELQSIFRTGAQDSGILNGSVFTDTQFTKKAFYEAMKQRRPLVHISSHFAFRAGDDSRSFLLLGDGTALTLNEMKRQGKLFEGVELLTLSACNTAATQPDANGKEIDGFAELAQRLGAQAVMATLWQVSDSSTPWLMRDFYAERQNRTGMTKATALRNAQLALLNGTSKIKPLPNALKGGTTANFKLEITPNGTGNSRSDTRAEIVYVEARNAPPYKLDENRPFAHPYFWSPFVLYGNIR